MPGARPPRYGRCVTAPIDPTFTSAWAELDAHRASFDPDLRGWFAADDDRVGKLSFPLADLHVEGDTHGALVHAVEGMLLRHSIAGTLRPTLAELGEDAEPAVPELECARRNAVCVPSQSSCAPQAENSSERTHTTVDTAILHIFVAHHASPLSIP